MKLRHWILALPAMLFFSCKPEVKESAPDFLAADIDSTVKPSEDFFLFANGGWIKKTPIPAGESSWGVNNLVQEDLYLRLKKINTDAENDKGPEGSTSQKIGDFWFSGMDTVQIEKQGLLPLQGLLDRIGLLQSKINLGALTAELHRAGADVLFSTQVSQDYKNSAVMALYLVQAGLGLPSRDYYFNTDSKSVAVRNAYHQYLQKTFQQLGADSVLARKKGEAVFQLETRLARASRKLADLRDPYANYNKMDPGSLQKLLPVFNWNNYFSGLGLIQKDSLIVGQPEFLEAVNKEIKTTALEDWKDYFRSHLIFAYAHYLDSTTDKNRFEYAKTLTGVDRQRERWKRVLDAEEQAIGEDLGQLFVKAYFSEKSRQRYSDLIEAVRTAYGERIEKLDWMSDSTKKKAFEKLGKINRKVGYPDKWKDLSTLKIDRGPYALNMLRANQWWFQYAINKLGKPVDRTEWSMTPQTYNAYYDPSLNEIVMPAAAFIIPGKRDEDLDDGFVYGYAAANWIGHEMTHGFDDQGRQFDAQGNLKNWWQQKDSIQFVERAEKIIKQFNEFNPVDTLHVNGTATQGENIADLGGLLIGLDAFKKTETFKKGEKIAGYTPLQRFFLGYAYGWLFQERKELLALLITTDVHAPAKERLNGPVVNVPEFYEAFDVKPGDKMYRPDSLRVKIW